MPRSRRRHISLELSRKYCELVDIDVKRTHLAAGPVDNLDIIEEDSLSFIAKTI